MKDPGKALEVKLFWRTLSKGKKNLKDNFIGGCFSKPHFPDSILLKPIPEKK